MKVPWLVLHPLMYSGNLITPWWTEFPSYSLWLGGRARQGKQLQWEPVQKLLGKGT